MSEQCDPEIYAHGEPVAVIADRPADAIEGLIQMIASESGQRLDWHYVAGWAVVKCIGDAELARQALRSHVGPYFCIIESDGTWTRDELA